MQVETIKINGITFNLDIEKAKSAGALTLPKKPAAVADLVEGNIFRFINYKNSYYLAGDLITNAPSIGFNVKTKNDFIRLAGTGEFSMPLDGKAEKRCYFDAHSRVSILNPLTGKYEDTIEVSA